MFRHPSIKSYFDEKLAEEETSLAFSKGLNYAGHKLMVPEKSHYQVLPYFNDRYALFNQGDRYELISNVCVHRQAKLLEGRGKAQNIACKLHCWTYETTGKLKAAPHFDHKPDLSLSSEKLNEWNGLLFRGRVPNFDVEKAGLKDYLNFDHYFFSELETTRYNFNWKTFIEIYLENYHVFSMHPGLKKFVTPNDLEWVFGEDFSVQKVGLGKDLLKATTPHYRHFQDALIARFKDKLPRYGAIWCFIYPNIMIEWYPEVLVVSTIYPDGPRHCVNHVEFYYPQEFYNKEPGYFEAEKKAYMETAIEDEEACLLLDKGREALFKSNEEEHGPVDSFLEAGVAKFYEFLTVK